METKNPLERLVAALKDFGDQADREQKKAAIPFLARLAKKLQIQMLELQQQRLMLTAAESARDKETLRALEEFSQHEEIRDWSAEILNLKRQPRTLPFQNIQL